MTFDDFRFIFSTDLIQQKKLFKGDFMKLMSIVSLAALCLVAGVITAKEHKKGSDNNGRKKIVVTTTKDCGKGSLRKAIEKANNHCCPKGTHIVFDLKQSDCGYNEKTKTWHIKPETDLPDITCHNVFVDGLSQEGSKPNTKPAHKKSDGCYKIELRGPGSEAKRRRGFGLLGDNTEITGLKVKNWPVGIQSNSNGNVVSQSEVSNNSLGITADVAPSAPTTPISSIKVTNAQMQGNNTAITSTNAAATTVNNVTATNNLTAVFTPAATIPVPAQMLSISNSTFQGISSSTQPQINTTVPTAIALTIVDAGSPTAPAISATPQAPLTTHAASTTGMISFTVAP